MMFNNQQCRVIDYYLLKLGMLDSIWLYLQLSRTTSTGANVNRLLRIIHYSYEPRGGFPFLMTDLVNVECWLSCPWNEFSWRWWDFGVIGSPCFRLFALLPVIYGLYTAHFAQADSDMAGIQICVHHLGTPKQFPILMIFTRESEFGVTAFTHSWLVISGQ